MAEGQDNAALYKAIMLCTPQQSDGSKQAAVNKPFNSTVAVSQPLGTSGMKARKTCSKKPSPAQIQHRQYLKNLRNMIKANIERSERQCDEEKCKRQHAAQCAEKQRKMVSHLKDVATSGEPLSADALETVLAKKPLWALTENQVQQVEEQDAEQAEEELVSWATTLDWSKYLNENEDFKRIVSVAKKTADDLFFEELVNEFNADVDDAAVSQPCPGDDESAYSIDTSASAIQRRQQSDVCSCEESEPESSHRALVKKAKEELTRVNPDSANVHSDVSVSAMVNHCKQQIETGSVDLKAPDPIKIVHCDKERNDEVQVQNLPYQYRCPAV